MRVHILCFGNLIAGDDGFGIHVCARLRAQVPTAPGLDIAVVDAGLLGFSALSHFEHCDVVLVVDALAYGGKAGRVHRLDLRDVAAPREAFSAHALDLNHLFHVLPILFEGRSAPRVVIIGAEITPPDGTYAMTLSPEVSAAIEPALALITGELGELASEAGLLAQPLVLRAAGE
jgi:hydrogenase maturation protease